MTPVAFTRQRLISTIGVAALVLALVPAVMCQDDDAAMVHCPKLPSNGALPICVTTYHNQNSRKGINTNETILTKTAIQTRGLTSFTDSVTGQVYAQPLFLPAVKMAVDGTLHNVVYVATEANWVYAFDGDTSQTTAYWSLNLTTPPGQGNRYQVTAGMGTTFDINCGNIQPNVGITGTPVINITSTSDTEIDSGVLYVVARSKSSTSPPTTYYQTLYALDVTGGAHLGGTPIIAWTDINNVTVGTTTFDQLHQNQRGALLFQAGAVYVTWGAHCDNGISHPTTASWFGWLMSYKLQSGSLVRTGAWTTSQYPEAGIWQSGAGPAGDGTNLYFATGNGSTTAAPLWSENPCNNPLCYGDSIVKMSGTPVGQTFSVADYFTPRDHPVRFCNDYDVGSGGLVLLLNTGFTPSNLLVQSGKEGNIYLVDAGSMGLYGGTTGSFTCTPPPVTTGTDNIVQHLYGDLCTTAGTDPECGLQGSPVFASNNVFFGPRCQPIKQYNLAGPNPPKLTFKTATTVGGSTQTGCNYIPSTQPVFGYPGADLAVSQYTGGAILWALDNAIARQSFPLLYAYDASNINGALLYSGNAGTGTAIAIAFAVPTVANGHVYVGNSNQLVVFHLP